MKLTFKKNRDQEITCKYDEQHIKRLENIIKLQNKKLLLQVARHYKWDYKELCNNYIKRNSK